MGHYDSCYEADNKAKATKRDIDHREELLFIWDNALDPQEKDFIISVVRDAANYKMFFKLLKKLSK
jgi:hypothetical protein